MGAGETGVDWMDAIIDGDFSSGKKENTTKKTPQEIEDGLFGGNTDLDEIKNQVVTVRAMTTGKSLEETKDGSSSVDDTKKYTTEELFLGLDEEDEEPEEEVEEESLEDRLVVYPEPEDGVDTESEKLMRNSFHNQGGGFYLVTTEYERAKRSLRMIGNNIYSDKIKILEWDSIDGMPEIDDMEIDLDDETKKFKLFATLTKISHFIDEHKGDEHYIFVIKDLSFFIKNSYEGRIIQAIEKILDKLKGTNHQLLITDMYERKIHENLDVMTKVKFDLPTEVDLNRMIIEIFPKLTEQQQKQLDKKNIKKIIDILLGIEYENARINLLNIFYQSENIDKNFFMNLINYKKVMINRHQALEYINPENGWDDYIGRKNFRDIIEDLKLRVDHKENSDDNSQKIGATVLLVGQPGTGKSYAAECVANYLGKPLIKVDLSKLLGKYQGDMQKAFEEMRKIFLAVKDQAVFWFDEYEKMVSTGNSNVSKSSTEMSLEGMMLGFMQDLEKRNTIVIITSNQPKHISSPTKRSGRVSETFYFDFPYKTERKHLIEFYLKRNGKIHLDSKTIEKLVEETAKFSESDIKGFIGTITKKYSDDRLRLLENKITFISFISVLETTLQIARDITNKFNMKDFFQDIHRLPTKDICKKYSIELVGDTQTIFESMKSIEDLLMEKTSLIVQSDIKIPMIIDWLMENKNLAKNKGNMADIIRKMKKEVGIDGYLAQIIDGFLDKIFDKDYDNEYEKIRAIDDIKDKRYLLDNLRNRELLLLIILSDIDQTLEVSTREYIYDQMDILYNKMEDIDFETFSQSIINIFEKDSKIKEEGVYDTILNMIGIYTSKIIFPEISGDVFIEKVKETQKGITWETDKDYCKEIHERGLNHAKFASKKERTIEEYSSKPIIDYNFFKNRQKRRRK